MSTLTEIVVPDIGGAENVEVIEIAVKPGDHIKENDTLITIESEKASIDIPAPNGGLVKELKVKKGDKVSQGSLILMLETTEEIKANSHEKKEEEKEKLESSEKSEAPVETKAADKPKAVDKPKATSTPTTNNAPVKSNEGAHAGPAVRRLAFQLGVDLSKVTGTARKGRIVPEDVHAFVKRIMQSQSSGGAGLNIAPMPEIDFSKFGEIEKTSLSRIKKISGTYLHRNWVSIPHITQFEEADITDMEAFRKENKAEFEKEGLKLTPLVFIIKAVVESLQAMPQFNSSLALDGESLILKKYYHIGVAVDTPNGLVVPVIRDADKKGIKELARELGELSKKAREGKLLPSEMQGGCFSISSLGGIGGTAFTPIINAPEVAILGVSRSEMKPKFIDNEFKPRLMLPLSLSYDHRVIDGADGARFVSHLSAGLSDLRRLLF